MKELDEPTARLLKSLDDESDDLWRAHRVRVWVFWIGGDKAKAGAWLSENGIAKLGFGIVAEGQADLESWNLDPNSSAMGILTCRQRKTMTVIPDLMSPDREVLKKSLSALKARQD